MSEPQRRLKIWHFFSRKGTERVLMNFMGSFLFTVLLLTVPQSFAASLAGKEKAIYNKMLESFAEEISSFDGTNEIPTVTAEFYRNWLQFVQQGTPLPQRWLQGYSWSKLLYNFIAPELNLTQPTPLSAIEKSTPPFGGREKSIPHSIKNLDLYARQRIGPVIVDALKKWDIPCLLYGGKIETVASAFELPPDSLHFIPSPYSNWGIHKAFVAGAAFPDGRPRYLTIIPPSSQYLSHYAKLFAQQDLELERSYLNRADQEQMKVNLRIAFQNLRSELPEKVDAVVMGYYNTMQSRLGTRSAKRPEINLPEGITAQLLQDSNGTSFSQYLILKSSQTIWGESTADIVESALELKPKAVIFMGSAGGITPTTNVYDVSVPAYFMLNGEIIPINNFLLHNPNLSSSFPKKGLVYGGVHGNTVSPAEQTKSFISAQVEAGVSTLDVEQNLVAWRIYQHNKTTSDNVMFGAVNIVTDKPSSFNFDFSQSHSLDHIDYTSKERARQLAVSITLSGMTYNFLDATGPEFSMMSCSAIFH